MTTPTDGGPAFPQSDKRVHRVNCHDGMSYRQYLVAQAIQGFATAAEVEYKLHGTVLDFWVVANKAVELADAVIRRLDE